VGAVVVVFGALCWSAALVVTDLRVRRLPDPLTLSGALVAVGWAFVVGQPWAVTGGLGWYLVCALPGRLSGRLRVGGGDAKLGLALGTAVATAGPVAWLTAVGASGILTLGTLTLPAVRRAGRDRLPHGPGMIVAAWAVLGLHSTGWW
jgi:leader peptidase (prepilin peptidase)/N-methyltransferase